MAAPSQLLGHTLGHYRIIEQIGAGGMGVVYRARDEQLERDVAVKVLPVGTLADEGARRRFRKEALALAKLNHPNIATIFEFSTQNDTDYLVTEYISGLSLDNKLAVGALSEEEVTGLGIQLAQGLGAAHEQGIVHRDLKPANLRLTSDGRLKILDFGLAQLMPHASDLGLTATMTKSQEVTGTLPYMAPEQLRGEPAEARTDIWASGAVLYEMATGHRPFEETVATALAGDIIHKAPPPPRRLRWELSPKLEAVILKCLEKEQANRYQSALELQADLGRLSTGLTPLVARRPWLWRVLVASAIAVVLAAMASYYLLTKHKSSASIRARRSVAVLGFKNLSGRPDAAWLSTALSEMLNTEMAAGEKLRTIPGEDVAHSKIDLSLLDTDSLGKDTLARLRKNLGSDFVVLGSYLDLGKEAGGQVRLDLRLQDAREGETIASISETGTEAQLLDLVSRTGEQLREKLGVGAVSANEVTEVKASLPSDPEATRFYSEGLAKLRVWDNRGALDSLEKAIAADPNFALAHSALAKAWSGLGYDMKAKEEAKKAFELSSKISREDQLSIEGRYREAVSDWDKAIEIYRTLFTFAPDNIEYGLNLFKVQRNAGRSKEATSTLDVLRGLPPPVRDDPRIDVYEAEVCDALGNFKQEQAAAIKAFDKAQAQGARWLMARALYWHAWAWENLGDWRNAAVAAEEARDIYAAAGDRSNEAVTLEAMGTFLKNRGDLAGAQKRYEEALAINRQTGTERGVASNSNNMAIVQDLQGNLTAAKDMWQQAQASYRRLADKDGEATILMNIALLLVDLGDLRAAQEDAQQALSIYREIGQDSGTAYALENTARVLGLQGNLSGAENMLRTALRMFQQGGDKHSSASTLYDLGEILRMKGAHREAGERYSEALAIQTEIGEQISAAESRLFLAELSNEEGRPADVEQAIREAHAEFHRQGQTDDEILSDAVLAENLLAQGRASDARQEVEMANPLVTKTQNLRVHLKFAIAAASVLAVTGKPAEAKASLEATLKDATKNGFVGYEFEAQLVLAGAEMKSGQLSAGRTHLAALEKDATAKGFLLIAHKAAAAAKTVKGDS